ncbi:MAG TPA: choice-of-anchor tandem repeat GloVer-containing protein, partial [Tepidisphaeraceae bacterium]|nr:choice-of-anchor tandem repeat GloVer-containing protein [Tepidisphaeraceae bacterium]
VTLVHGFEGTSIGNGDGANPDGDLIIDSADNIYGTTKNGGAFGDGTVFKISDTDSSPTVSILASFNGTDGNAPLGGLLLEGTTLYGNASSGGAHGDGVVFKISTAGGAITDLVSFNGLGAQGSSPQTSLVADSSGNLYGTTVSGGNGGTGDFGTVFQVNPNTNQLTTLYDFTNGVDGSRPQGRLAIDAQGDLFGACLMGGSTSVDGSIWKISGSSIRAGGAGIQVLHGFDDTDGYEPHAGVILVGTDLYGTTFGDRSVDYGTLFEISGGSFTTLHTFMYASTDGVQPDTDLYLAPGGIIYGLTRFGPGEIFSFEPSEIHNSDQLVFDQQLSNTAAGAAISPAVTVKIEDSAGNVITGDSSTVTIALGSGPSSALGGRLSEQAVGGVATFPDLSLGVAGTYTLVATDSITSLGSAVSASFVISSGGVGGGSKTGVKLVFLQQPQTSKLNGPISTIQVAVEDASGAIVTGDHSIVAISLAKGTPHATLKGTLNATAVNGVATFSILSLNQEGQFALTAADGSLAKAISNPFSIVPILVWNVEPKFTAAGKSIKLSVRVVDYLGKPVLTEKSSVTLGLSMGGTLVTKPAPVKKGVATFSKVSLTKAGTYQFQASDGLASPVTSDVFSVVPAPAKTMLFRTLPTTTPAGTDFKVVVELVDQYNNVATNNVSLVVLTLAAKPAGAILGGTVEESVISGLATFDDLSLAKTGTYKLKAIDVRATPKPATSNAFQVV